MEGELKIAIVRAGEMTQWLKALGEDLSSTQW